MHEITDPHLIVACWSLLVALIVALSLALWLVIEGQVEGDDGKDHY